MARDEAIAAARAANDVHVELKAHTKVLEALRETQIEQGKLLSRLVGRVDGSDARLAGVEARLDRTDARLAGVEARLDRTDARLAGVEARLDRTDARLEGVEDRLGRVESRINHIEREMREGFSKTATGMAQIVALISNLERN